MLDYTLPRAFIAQVPLEKRDEAKLLFLSRSTGQIKHLIFKDIINLLDERHLLVLNNTRVFPARLRGRNARGGKVEVLLIREREPRVWEVLGRPAKKLRRGETINFDSGNFLAAVLEDKLLRFNSFLPVMKMLDRYGQTPLPPYIKRPHPATDEEADRSRYQTVYAKNPGSCACPTAGLHFTPELLAALKNKGVGMVEITLHIGPGTFRPIKVPRLKDHCMEEELFAISGEAALSINSAIKGGKIIVGVGTSTVRALEEAGASGKVSPGDGKAGLFIHPGYRFKIVNGLITNFHQPGTTPLALVSAFAGESIISKAYSEALNRSYRFLSFGDSMFIV